MQQHDATKPASMPALTKGAHVRAQSKSSAKRGSSARKRPSSTSLVRRYSATPARCAGVNFRLAASAPGPISRVSTCARARPYIQRCSPNHDTHLYLTTKSSFSPGGAAHQQAQRPAHEHIGLQTCYPTHDEQLSHDTLQVCGYFYIPDFDPKRHFLEHRACRRVLAEGKVQARADVAGGLEILAGHLGRHGRVADGPGEEGARRGVVRQLWDVLQMLPGFRCKPVEASFIDIIYIDCINAVSHDITDCQR